MCDKPLGPNALEVTHKGEPAGGICDNCLNDAHKVRVLLQQGSNGIFVPEELSVLDESLSKWKKRALDNWGSFFS